MIGIAAKRIKLSQASRTALAFASLGAFFAGLPIAAHAQTAEAKSANVAQPDIQDIVVTARRDQENLQDVPESVQVVSGKSLQDKSITQLSEVSKLAPGLTISPDTTITLRAVTWAFGSGTPATPIYFNEVPFDPQASISTIFDIGQIEVLRGPQGTSRGAPSISGAVTISTRRPDLDRWGGYAQGQYGTSNHWSGQGAVNIPIIEGKLAIRLAAQHEENIVSPILSVNSNVRPDYRSNSLRATVLFDPTDTISIMAMYQRRRQVASSYGQVIGTGSPGSPALGIPANFNGPALTSADRSSVSDLPSEGKSNYDLITLNASWEVFGQKLTYNYGRQLTAHVGDFGSFSFNALDAANTVPGFEPFSPVTTTKAFFQTNEIRLSSTPDPDRPFDYDVGWFSKHSASSLIYGTPIYLSGAFGRPGTLPGVVTTPNDRYTLTALANISLGQIFDSFYGNVRFHLDENTELSGGLSILRDRIPVTTAVTTSSAFNAFSNPALPSPAFCPFVPGAIASRVYLGSPTVCEIGIPAGSGNSTEAHSDKFSHALYNFSFSHKFTPDLLAYATTGTSFRSGLPAINNTGLPANQLLPAPETATSYEVGVKATLNRRVRFSADIFQINYANQLTNFGGVAFYNSVSNAISQANVAFYRNIDSRIRGVEFEASAQPVDHLSLAAGLSYALIKSKGGSVPCNDASRPITAANPINYCVSPAGQTLNQQSPFQATVSGGYDLPVGAFDGYFRFNVNYQGKNPNFGNFADANGDFLKTPGYAVVDLFAGVTGGSSAWDIGVFAKNVFNKRSELSRTSVLNNVYGPFAGTSSGYNAIRTNPPREIGVSLRYAFGSR